MVKKEGGIQKWSGKGTREKGREKERKFAGRENFTFEICFH